MSRNATPGRPGPPRRPRLTTQYKPPVFHFRRKSRSSLLSQAAHAARLPAGLLPEDWVRIRRAAYAPPQVLTRSDLDASSDDALERLGAIQISKAAGGGRPSRWITPAHVAVALAQLDATPLANTLRSQMQQRLHQRSGLMG